MRGRAAARVRTASGALASRLTPAFAGVGGTEFTPALSRRLLPAITYPKACPVLPGALYAPGPRYSARNSPLIVAQARSACTWSYAGLSITVQP